MKHYRILEIKDDQKQYIIQYLKPIFFGLFFWKKVNDTIYYKYDDALIEVKKIIKNEDYNTDYRGYHYIDAYKLFKPKTVKEVIKEVPVIKEVIKEVPVIKEVIKEVTVIQEVIKEVPTLQEVIKEEPQKEQAVINKSVFIPNK